MSGTNSDACAVSKLLPRLCLGRRNSQAHSNLRCSFQLAACCLLPLDDLGQCNADRHGDPEERQDINEKPAETRRITEIFVVMSHFFTLFVLVATAWKGRNSISNALRGVDDGQVLYTVTTGRYGYTHDTVRRRVRHCYPGHSASGRQAIRYADQSAELSRQLSMPLETALAMLQDDDRNIKQAHPAGRLSRSVGRAAPGHPQADFSRL